MTSMSKTPLLQSVAKLIGPDLALKPMEGLPLAPYPNGYQPYTNGYQPFPGGLAPRILWAGRDLMGFDRPGGTHPPGLDRFFWLPR